MAGRRARTQRAARAESGAPPALSAEEVSAFRERVLGHYREHGRHDLPWRLTRDPYAVLVSEVMLQQTQVARVVPFFERWMDAFPTPDALAAAPLDAVLEHWQGLGYNRRAVALKRAGEAIVCDHGGEVPRDYDALLALPGVGPATASAVLAFAYGEARPYIETNIRSVYLHEFFADAAEVPDSVILPLVEVTLDRDDPRTWYYALMDWGVHLKRTVPNPSCRSRHHTRQSAFEGSHRQLRARIVRAVMATPGTTAPELAEETGADVAAVERALEELVVEGFFAEEGERYRIA